MFPAKHCFKNKIKKIGHYACKRDMILVLIRRVIGPCYILGKLEA